MNSQNRQSSWRRLALTNSEWDAKLVLDEVFQHDEYVVFPGFKLSTVIYEPPNGFTRHSTEWNYATRTHFDFVVCHAKTRLPEFAIELDDPTHWKNSDTQHHDRMKNALCEAAGFELLRIESSALSASSKTGNRRLIEYLIDARELGKGFYEMQERGSIPADEVYDYRNSIGRNPQTGELEFVNDFARPAVNLAFKLHGKGVIKDYYIDRLNVYWRNRWAEGWAWLPYNDELYFFETYRVRSYQFYCGIPAGELAEDLAVAAIGEKLKRLHPNMLLCGRAALEDKFNRLQVQRSELDGPFLYDHVRFHN